MILEIERVREYRESDYEACESLVSCAWGLYENFKPKEFSDVVKYMYTKGSVISSNFCKVMEINEKVVGFIFGLNEMTSESKDNAWFGDEVLRRMRGVKGMKLREKIKLFEATRIHDENRLKVVACGKSEIILFVINPAYQGYGYGKRLLSEFISDCKKIGVKSIIVETNQRGASGFYESVAFKHIGDFFSPLHEYAVKGGQACMYEYII